ncbi:hypothetical protein DSO57_1018460 [Entomophthora muscae]|uniref:Uncharacterized protein n=1 Tax=Entomophthora muscae TaxID=34485 RepID=A0ACC2RIZ7_9FUNG|nr:hypothetical protein DSO57_1018460 [Entomophthora muscae]
MLPIPLPLRAWTSSWSSRSPTNLSSSQVGDFLLHNDRPGFKEKIIYYSTQQNLMELKRTTTWLVESTFATCLQMFYQLWMVIPLAFILLPGATEAIYTCAFSIPCQEFSLLLPTDKLPEVPLMCPAPKGRLFKTINFKFKLKFDL